MVKLDIQSKAKLKKIERPKFEPISYPSHMDYDLKGKVRDEFSKSGWVLTRQVWRILLMDKQLDKEMKNGNEN